MRGKRPKQISRTVHFDGRNDKDGLRALSTYLDVRFDRHVADLPDEQRRLLGVLQRYYAYTNNGFLLIEAFEICVSRSCNPPVWILEAVNAGLQRAISGKTSLQAALRIGASDRRECAQFREQQPVMIEIHRQVQKIGKVQPACAAIALRRGLNRESLEKQYRRFWQGFFEHVWPTEKTKSD